MRLCSSCLRQFVRCYSVNALTPAVQQPLNFVNGHRVNPESAKKSQEFDLLSPATGEILRHVPSTGSHDLDKTIDSAREAFPGWRRLPGFERGQVLKKAADILRRRLEEVARVEVLDTGKPIWEARFDIAACADSIEYYGGLAANISGNFSQVANGSFAYTIREPYGVVGGIGAWNYPLQMASWKSAPALACGNTIVFKPSPLTPLTAVMLGEVYKEAGLLDGCYSVVQGHTETGQLLSNHSNIAKMSFTGSVETGSRIMASCAKDIKKVTLELGGKSPLIIFGDCDIDNAVKGAMLANFLTQGQVCSNGTRVFVEKKIVRQFLEKLVTKTRNMKIGDPNDEKTTIGATISREQAEKTLGYVDIARKEGATVLCGGERVSMEPPLSGGYYLSPCILTDCTDNMTVVREEIFGCVMSVMTFDTEEEVIKRANDTHFGLAGGVFTKDLQRAHRVASELEAGSLYINNYNVYPVGVPFGGFKMSGIGRENGPETLDYYSQIKSVYVEMGDVDAPF
ncbi:hypothetical protein ScPMuIL_016120 [Solemya velum]